MLKNLCVSCDHVIVAPDDMRGREMVCPRCEATNVLRSPEDLQAEAAEGRRRREEERVRFLRNLSRASGSRRGRSGWDYDAPVEGRSAAGLASHAGQRLRDISVYLAGFAYLLLALAILVGAVLAFGLGLGVSWKAFAFLASALVGVFLFIFLKFMSDGLRALADLAELGRSIDERLALLTSEGRETGSHTGASDVGEAE